MTVEDLKQVGIASLLSPSENTQSYTATRRRKIDDFIDGSNKRNSSDMASVMLMLSERDAAREDRNLQREWEWKIEMEQRREEAEDRRAKKEEEAEERRAKREEEAEARRSKRDEQTQQLNMMMMMMMRMFGMKPE